MAFNTSNKGSGGGGGSDVDWDALNTHVVTAAETQDKARNIVGIVSSIIDLGEQQREDAEMEWKGTPDLEAKEIENKPNTYFADLERWDNQKREMNTKRFKCWPQKPCQQVAITIDFPQIIVDKGQFFDGDSNPAPLRMLLNGEFGFNVEGGGHETRVNRGYELNLTKKSGVWSLPAIGILHKMAKAAGLCAGDGSFMPEDIDKLLGKPFQFEMQVYMKPSKKDKSKSYFTESIKYTGMPAEGVPIPPIDEALLSMVQFTEENSPESLKYLRRSVKLTQVRANDYKGSALEAQLEALKPVKKSTQGHSGPEAGEASEGDTGSSKGTEDNGGADESKSQADNTPDPTPKADTPKDTPQPEAEKTTTSDVDDEWGDDIPF